MHMSTLVYLQGEVGGMRGVQMSFHANFMGEQTFHANFYRGANVLHSRYAGR